MLLEAERVVVVRNYSRLSFYVRRLGESLLIVFGWWRSLLQYFDMFSSPIFVCSTRIVNLIIHFLLKIHHRFRRKTCNFPYLLPIHG